MTLALVLTAAGSSTRMGGAVKKEYLPLSSEPGISVLSAALYAFYATGLFSRIVITLPPLGEADARDALAADSRFPPLPWESPDLPCLTFAQGGKSRQESVFNGLETLERCAVQDGVWPDLVLIHDAARPWVTADTIRSVADTAAARGAAVPGIPPVDTQKEVDPSGRILRHLDRSSLVSVQTPQGFRFREILSAHRKASADGRVYTDDTEIWGRYSGDVFVCPGDPANKKVTFREDLP